MGSVGVLERLARRRGRRCSRRPYWAISRRRWLAAQLLVGPPEDGLVRPLAQEVGTPAVAMSSESAVRVAGQLACSVVEVTEHIATAGRYVVDDPPLVFVTGDVGRRIRWRLGLQLMNEVRHRGRDRLRVLRPRPGGAAGCKCRGHDHKRPRLHRHETMDRPGDCGRLLPRLVIFKLSIADPIGSLYVSPQRPRPQTPDRGLAGSRSRRRGASRGRSWPKRSATPATLRPNS